jgi:hypothetical protein
LINEPVQGRQAVAEILSVLFGARGRFDDDGLVDTLLVALRPLEG